MVGKRKRDEESQDTAPIVAPVHGSSIFVSNLPYTATSTDLQTLFSDISPVKNAFVVLDKETKVSKGVGYVTFALKEDAAQCVEKQSVELNGRALRVGWPDTKPHAKNKQAGPTSEKKEAPKRPFKPRPTPKPQTKDAAAIRTITITSLPSSIDSHALWKKVRKYVGADRLIFPVLRDDGTTEPATANVLFKTPAQAQEAAQKLHAHTYKGSVLSVCLKKRLETTPNRAGRLIVRNLPWKITEQQLKELFIPHGPVYSVTIPLAKDQGEDKTTPKIKGFAFVWMLTKADAEKAIEGVNGKIVGERPIAVDWALSKNKWEDERTKFEDSDTEKKADSLNSDEEEDQDNKSESDEDAEMKSGSEDEKSDDSSESALGIHDDDSETGSEDESVEEDQDQDGRGSPVKPQLPPPEAGTTLFLRNVPWETTEDELRQLLRAFGPLRYVRIVMDKELGRSLGTAFACYWKKEDADKVVHQSELLQKESGINIKPNGSAPSLLAPDPSSSLARSLVLHGRTMSAVRAVTRDTAEKLREAGAKSREKADKRNMYLMREGVIFPRSNEAATLTPVELEKRMASYNARKKVLQTNPSLYVSKTRLSVRQLPTYVNERSLKRLALHAIREFDREVREGTREGLTAEEMASEGVGKVLDELMGEEVQIGRPPTKPVEQKPKGKSGWKMKHSMSRVKQTKIVRVHEKVDPITGKGRSKGYGFLEIERHTDALKILRWANNNPTTGELFKTWWEEQFQELVETLENDKKKPKDNAKQTAPGDKDEDTSIKLKRVKDALASGVAASKRTLVIEFSIENVLIVKKRAGREVQDPDKKSAIGRSPGGKPSSKLHTSKSFPKSVKDEEVQEDERPRKRKKTSSTDGKNSQTTKPKAPSDSDPAPPKPGKAIGGIIGKKRKLRKAKGKSS